MESWFEEEKEINNIFAQNTSIIKDLICKNTATLKRLFGHVKEFDMRKFHGWFYG